MAKRSGGPNKSAAIRQYLDANPNAKPREIVDALKVQGLDVTPAFVSTIKSKAGSSEGQPTARRGRPKGSARGTAAGRKAAPRRRAEAAAAPAATRGRAAATSKGESISVEGLVQAKKLADALGGVSQARAALAALEKITG